MTFGRKLARAKTFLSARLSETDDITGSFCCHVHFVAGNEAAERWSAENPAGYLLDLPDAPGRVLTIAVIALESDFERVLAEATPIVESLEIHPG